MIIASITDSQTPVAPSPVKQEQKSQRKPRAQPPMTAAASPSPVLAAAATPALSAAASAPNSSLPPSVPSAHVPTMAPPSAAAASPASAAAAAAAAPVLPPARVVPTATAAAAAVASPLHPASEASPVVKQEPAASSPPQSTLLHVDVASATADTPMDSEPLTPLHTASTPATASASPNRMAAKAAALKRRTPATQRRQAVARAPLSDEEEEPDEKEELDDEDTPMESTVDDSPTKQEPPQPQQHQSCAAASAAPPVQSQHQPLSYDPTMPPPPPSPARRVTSTNVSASSSSSANPPSLGRVPSTPDATPSPSALPSAAVAPYSSSSGISPAVIDALAVQAPTLGSCHHCKNMRALADTVQCSSRLFRRSDANGRRLPVCTKRFCWACLQKNYPVSTAAVQAAPDAWTCPACEETCFCIKCRIRLSALGRTPGDPTVVQPPKPLPPPAPAPAPVAAPAPIQRKESAPPVRKSQAPAAAAAPIHMAAPSPQQQQLQLPPQQPLQHSGPIRMHPPIQLQLAAGTEVVRVSPTTECHALVVQLCEPHTLSVVVRLTPELAKQQSVYPECSVHFPLPGCPLWLPPGAHYRICNLALDEPVWTAVSKSTAEKKQADATAAMAPGESQSTDAEFPMLVQSMSPGSVAVVEIWVQSSAPSAAETAATREMVSDRLAALQAQAHKLRAESAQRPTAARGDRDQSASDSSDASDSDDEYGAASNRKRKRGVASAAASSKQPRVSPASSEVQLLDTQIADLQAYLEGYAPASAVQAQQPQPRGAV